MPTQLNNRLSPAPRRYTMNEQTMRSLRVRQMGLCDYQPVLADMKQHIASRGNNDIDELWLLQHRSVITTGVRARHLPPPCRDIPAGVEIVQTDRGGLTTAHNPGQAVAYCLWQIRRLRLDIPQLVRGLEQCVINNLADWGLVATTRDSQPGVYIGDKKIASIGLRLRQGWCYHGLSINVCNDLSIFDHFEPCGIDGLQLTSLQALGVDIDVLACQAHLLEEITRFFGFGPIDTREG